MICVLIVDDQPDVRLAFAYMLDALGCKVAEAPDGKTALAHLARNKVDVVLTDLYMPDMNGMELIERIHAQRLPRPKVIAMTGSGNLASGASLQAASIVGADAVLKKPITKDKLMNTIQDLMGARHPPSSWASSDTPAKPAKGTPPTERRSKTRVATEQKATGLVQKILANPHQAADELEAEIRTTGDVTMISALIFAAESVAKLRGIDLKRPVAAVRKRLKDAGFEL